MFYKQYLMVAYDKNKNVTNKTFHTLDEAKAFRDNNSRFIRVVLFDMKTDNPNKKVKDW